MNSTSRNHSVLTCRGSKNKISFYSGHSIILRISIFNRKVPDKVAQLGCERNYKYHCRDIVLSTQCKGKFQIYRRSPFLHISNYGVTVFDPFSCEKMGSVYDYGLLKFCIAELCRN